MQRRLQRFIDRRGHLDEDRAGGPVDAAYAEGDVLHGENIGRALRRALRLIETGRRPALADVVTHNR